MKKIYYLQKHPVQIGDVIEYAGIRAILTEKIIELNPELFKIEEEYSKQELLDYAKKHYPVGTVYKHFNFKYTPKTNFFIATKTDYHFDSAGYFQNAIWGSGLNNFYGVVYHDGKWAEILKPKFITEDGVDIYGDMKTYLVHPDDSLDICFCYSLWNGDTEIKGSKYFYHKENALAYIEKHKEKTLDDYEEVLFERGDSMICSSGVVYFSVYGWLKDNEPKLYYTKILQLIADDLNDGWVAAFTNADEKWCISEKDIIHYVKLRVHGPIYFKSKELAEKARVILGDKVKYLFN